MTATLHFQLLDHSVEVSFDDAILGMPLRYVTASAAQPDIKPTRAVSVHVTGYGPWQVHHDGQQRTARTPDEVVYLAYRCCYNAALAARYKQGWLSFHGLLADVDERRVMMLGAKGTGKTTLAMKLLLTGQSVLGDEWALVRDGQSVAMPRRFHIKSGTFDVIPQLAELADGLPTAISTLEGPLTGFDPAEAGFDWTITTQPLDAVVILEAGHGSASAAEPVSTVDAVRLATNYVHSPADRRQVVHAVTTNLGQLPAFRLRVGPLDSTIVALRDGLRPV